MTKLKYFIDPEEAPRFSQMEELKTTRARVPHGDTTIGSKPFVMRDIFHPVREDFVEKDRR